MTTTWKVWFHSRDPLYRGFGFEVRGTHAEAIEQAKARAGRSFTFTIKQTYTARPNQSPRRHARP